MTPRGRHPAPLQGISNNALGALLTMLAMLCFAAMDAISKSLVVDYSVGQMMWIRYALLCLFAWFVVRRRGLRTDTTNGRPAKSTSHRSSSPRICARSRPAGTAPGSPYTRVTP